MTKLDDDMTPAVEMRDKPYKLFPPITLSAEPDKKDHLREYLRRLPKSAGS